MSKPTEDKNIQIPNDVLRQLLTSSEIRMIKNRYQILNLLSKGVSVRGIASQVKVGTDTVVRVSKLIEQNNIKFNKRIKKPRFKSPTPWIFGKSE